MQKTLMTIMVLAGSSAAVAGESASGTWMMTNGKVTVEVDSCGARLCGTIVGLKKPLDKYGKPKLDKENPDPALRNRPVIGLSLLTGMKPMGDGKWEGAIYNPDDGRTYSAKMTVDGKVMKVRGCLVVFCKTREFVRVE